jgi:hypothetical protein
MGVPQCFEASKRKIITSLLLLSKIDVENLISYENEAYQKFVSDIVSSAESEPRPSGSGEVNIVKAARGEG